MNDGGPAFPSNVPPLDYVDFSGAHVRSIPRTELGMTLRDYFAAKAMQALIVNPEQAQARGTNVAETAYAAADAMLKARQA